MTDLFASDDVAEVDISLAHDYLVGNKVEKDEKKAFGLYMTAAVMGNPLACDCVAMCCENGWGIAKNHELALSYCEIAAESGDHRYANNLGDLGYRLVEKKEYVLAARALYSARAFRSDEQFWRRDVNELRKVSSKLDGEEKIKLLFFCALIGENTNWMMKYLQHHQSEGAQNAFVTLVISNLESATSTVAKHMHGVIATLIAENKSSELLAIRTLQSYFEQKAKQAAENGPPQMLVNSSGSLEAKSKANHKA